MFKNCLWNKLFKNADFLCPLRIEMCTVFNDTYLRKKLKGKVFWRSNQFGFVNLAFIAEHTMGFLGCWLVLLSIGVCLVTKWSLVAFIIFFSVSSLIEIFLKNLLVVYSWAMRRLRATNLTNWRSFLRSQYVFDTRTYHI